MSDSTGTASGPGGPGDDPSHDPARDETGELADDALHEDDVDGDEGPHDDDRDEGAVTTRTAGGSVALGAVYGSAAGGSVALGDARHPSTRRGPVTRVRSIGTFYRQVVSELRKVIWPTRNELITYTSVVIVFVVVMVVIVSIFDFAFSQAVLQVFGDSSL